MAFMIPIFVAMSTFGGVNGILLTSSRLFYAGACEGQMPEILCMIEVNKNTPAPAVLIVVSKGYLIQSFRKDINNSSEVKNFSQFQFRISGSSIPGVSDIFQYICPDKLYRLCHMG